jgi:hypothetical protein
VTVADIDAFAASPAFAGESERSEQRAAAAQ